MPRANNNVVLNRLLATQRFSMADYLSEAPPWTRSGNELLTEGICGIVRDHKHYARALVEAIDERDGTIEADTFPMAFLSLNDLTLDYLLAGLIKCQQRSVDEIKQCVDDLSEDPRACSLASEVLGSERAHLDILNEFVPMIASV